MIINKDKKIHLIQFKHKGMNLKFQMPVREEYIDSIKEKKRNKFIDDVAQIEFEDSNEIKSLVLCLNAFYREVLIKANEWRQVCD